MDDTLRKFLSGLSAAGLIMAGSLPVLGDEMKVNKNLNTQTSTEKRRDAKINTGTNKPLLTERVSKGGAKGKSCGADGKSCVTPPKGKLKIEQAGDGSNDAYLC